MAPDDPQRQERVLVLSLYSCSDQPICKFLQQEALACECIADPANLAAQVRQGAGALIIEQRALSASMIKMLVDIMRDQPIWSNLPLIVAQGPQQEPLPGELGAILFLEHPVRRRELVSMVRAALQMRRRQYQVRDQLVERSRMEEELRRAQEWLQRVFQSGMIGIAVSRADGRVLEANDYYLRLTGFTRQEVLAGRASWTEVTAPEHMPACREAMNQLQRTGTARPYEKEYIRRDGTRVPVLVSLSQMGEASDQYVAYAQDMTEYRRAEEARRQAEQAYRRLFDNRLNGMARGRVIRDEAGRLVDVELIEVNDAFEQMTGLARQNVIGRRIREAYPDMSDECFGPVSLCGQVALSSQEGQVEFYQEHLQRWYSLYAYSPRAGEFIAIMSDITERKQAEQQLKQWSETLERRVAERTIEVETRAAQLRLLAEELIQAEERERRRLAQVLHDHLQQLLVGARFSLGLLRRRLPDEHRDASQQVDDLLDQSIRMSRSLTAELSPTVLYESGLAQALSWLAGWMRDKHSLSVDVQADASINPQEKVRVLLFQAVRELLFNVVKHAGTDRARVRMHEQQGQVRIVVEDEGAGFDPAEARARHELSPGFGLFSIGQRLQWLGGEMHIDSAPGRGTRIELLAPLHQPEGTGHDLVQEAPLAEVLQQAATAPGGRHPAKYPEPIRVVLADDHAVLRDGLAQLLQAEPDIEVVGQAADGLQAVGLAAQMHPDVVLMDVSMPGLNGIEATRQIKNCSPETRVIGLSMHVRAGMADAMRQAGASGYLTKTVGPEDLVRTIRAAT